MAVYTEVPAERLAAFLARYDGGTLVSAKGIAEGVSNSNFLVETSTARYILTLYERRITESDLPFFIDLMEHLADAGLPVPRPIRDRTGKALQQLEGRAACLIQYLPGVSVSHPTPPQCRSAAAALARLHLAGQRFGQSRTNHLSRGWWAETAASLHGRLNELSPGLQSLVDNSLAHVGAHWPGHLPAGIVHADLFPDNVLMLGDKVSGLIDFYFACTDLYAYDLAVLIAAWAFPADGSAPDPALLDALLAGYQSVRPLSPAELAALPTLGMGAALRFLLSRAQDWFQPSADALVLRKDPMPFARRLAWHSAQLGHG